MKNIVAFIHLIIATLLLFISCDKFPEIYYSIQLLNNTDNTIYCINPKVIKNDVCDTFVDKDYIDIPPQDWRPIYVTFSLDNLDQDSCMQYLFSQFGQDTMTLIICEKNTMDGGKGFVIKQRYYVSAEDAIKLLNFKSEPIMISSTPTSRSQNTNQNHGFKSAMLSFPPTSEMRHIKMYPPYGTYDEKGNLKE